MASPAQALPQGSTYVGIDVGITNLAYAQIDSARRVLAWRVQALNVPKVYEVGIYAKAVRGFCKALPASTHYACERQIPQVSAKANVGGRASVPQLQHVLACEVAIHAAMPQDVARMNSVAVSNYYSLPKTRAKKKPAAVRLVRHMMDTGYVTVSDATRQMFYATAKRDDLADALLIALARLAWRCDKRPEGALCALRAPDKMPPIRKPPGAAAPAKKRAPKRKPEVGAEELRSPVGAPPPTHPIPAKKPKVVAP